MKLQRTGSPGATISLVSMIDVLMIMLVFFMVTSTYLDLRMIPMAERGDDRADEAPPPSDGAPAEGSATLLLRLGADGVIRAQGAPVTPAALGQLLARRLGEDPALSVVVLPSGHADAQALVALLDTAAAAGVRRLRILRLEGAP